MAFTCGNTDRLICMLVLVAIYFVVELVVGYVINSISLVADAFHMLSDFMALVVGLIATRIAKWPRSSKNTFGWQRAEVMGGLINTVMLVTLCCTILLQAIQRFVQPEQIGNPRLMIYVGSGGLLINILGLIVLGAHSHDGSGTTIEVTEDDALDAVAIETPLNAEADKAFYVQKRTTEGSMTFESRVSPLYLEENHVSIKDSHRKHHSHSHQAGSHKKANQSLNMRAVFLHVLADFFGSVIVVISAVLLEFAPGEASTDGKWKLYIDPAMSVIMVIIILTSALPLMYKAALILLQSVPSEICLKNLKSKLENIDGIHKIHDLHVWRLQSNCIIGTVHIRCANLPDYVQVARRVKQLFHEFDIHCTTIQPEFEECTEQQLPDLIDYRACVLDCGPNKNCQSDTCCPAPLTGGSSMNMDAENQSIAPPLAITAAYNASHPSNDLTGNSEPNVIHTNGPTVVNLSSTDPTSVSIASRAIKSAVVPRSDSSV